MKSLQTDISLIAQVVVFHNKRAFDTLVKKYQSQVRRFFLHQTLGNEFLSEDLAQETFIKAYLNLASFHNLSSFSTWLLRIAYNVFYDHLRKQPATTTFDMEKDTHSVRPEQVTVDMRIDIYDALKKIRPEERICLTLFYMEDQSIQKISAITGMPANTVKSHLVRGRDKLSIYLKQHGYE